MLFLSSDEDGVVVVDDDIRFVGFGLGGNVLEKVIDGNKLLFGRFWVGTKGWWWWWWLAVLKWSWCVVTNIDGAVLFTSNFLNSEPSSWGNWPNLFVSILSNAYY